MKARVARGRVIIPLRGVASLCTVAQRTRTTAQVGATRLADQPECGAGIGSGLGERRVGWPVRPAAFGRDQLTCQRRSFPPSESLNQRLMHVSIEFCVM